MCVPPHLSVPAGLYSLPFSLAGDSCVVTAMECVHVSTDGAEKCSHLSNSAEMRRERTYEGQYNYNDYYGRGPVPFNSLESEHSLPWCFGG